MIIHIVARIDGEVALSSFVRVGSRPVFQVNQHLMWSHVLTLCTIHEGLHHLDGQVGILAEASHVTAPTWFGYHINLRTQNHVQTHGTIFLGHGLAKLLYQLRITGSGDTYLAFLARPLAEILLATDVSAQGCSMTRVGREHDRNTQTGSLGILLHGVTPQSEEGWLCNTIVQDVSEVALLDVSLHIGTCTHLALPHGTLIVATRTDGPCVGLLAQFSLRVIYHMSIGWNGDVRMEHQSHFLFQRHLAYQVVYTILHR